jgi:hypothetical protein
MKERCGTDRQGDGSNASRGFIVEKCPAEGDPSKRVGTHNL